MTLACDHKLVIALVLYSQWASCLVSAASLCVSWKHQIWHEATSESAPSMWLIISWVAGPKLVMFCEKMLIVWLSCLATPVLPLLGVYGSMQPLAIPIVERSLAGYLRVCA